MSVKKILLKNSIVLQIQSYCMVKQSQNIKCKRLVTENSSRSFRRPDRRLTDGRLAVWAVTRDRACDNAPSHPSTPLSGSLSMSGDPGSGAYGRFGRGRRLPPKPGNDLAPAGGKVRAPQRRRRHTICPPNDRPRAAEDGAERPILNGPRDSRGAVGSSICKNLGQFTVTAARVVSTWQSTRSASSDGRCQTSSEAETCPVRCRWL